MDDPDDKQYPQTIPPCQRFAASGNCSGCQNDHHPNLNPALVGMVAPQQYRVPNEVGVACLTCIQNFRECDKQSRHPTDDRDPCSECRHFGGENAKCKIAPTMSYNDTVYRQMLVRGARFEYKLPPFISARSKGPMPAERIKIDWQGQSAETLMAKGDFLPAGVRDRPRAFTVPARESGERAKSRRYLATQRQRLSQSTSLPSFSQTWQANSQYSIAPPYGSAQPTVLSSQPPPLVPMAWVTQPGSWAPQYAIGYQAPSPQAAYPHWPYPQAPTYPHVPYPNQMPVSLPQRPHFPAPALPPPPPPSFPVKSRHLASFSQTPSSSSSRRSVASADNQQSSKKKRFGFDGIFSTDVLEREVLSDMMDTIHPTRKKRFNSSDNES